MKNKILAIVLLLLLLFSLSGCGGSAPAQDAGSGEPAEYALKYGELLEFTDNRETNGVVIVKAKISPSSTNALTVAQNYHNVVDLIKHYDLSGCELQYWAVADMTDGTENKVVSFTVPADQVGIVASGEIVATQLPDLVTDLWILPSLCE